MTLIDAANTITKRKVKYGHIVKCPILHAQKRLNITIKCCNANGDISHQISNYRCMRLISYKILIQKLWINVDF